MKYLSKEDYLSLIESARRDAEGHDELDNYDIPDDAWMPSESPNKAKMERARAASAYGMIDVLKYRKEQIRDAIYKSMNLQVGEFIIHIRRYSGHPKDKQLDGPLVLDIDIMQEKYKTPSGAPCKMSYKFDFFQDNRFASQPWITHFDAAGHARDIPVETVVEIVKYIQIIQRLNAFA
jgi:hypothetical protein